MKNIRQLKWERNFESLRNKSLIKCYLLRCKNKVQMMSFRVSYRSLVIALLIGMCVSTGCWIEDGQVVQKVVRDDDKCDYYMGPNMCIIAPCGIYHPGEVFHMVKHDTIYLDTNQDKAKLP